MNSILSMYFCILVLATTPIIYSEADAHRDGCHRWHSCPSDSGSYTCGDIGYCSECPDNNYCKAGQPIRYEEPAKPVTKNPVLEKPVPKTEKKTEPKKIETKQSAKPELICDGKGMCITGIIQRVIDGDTLIIDKYTIRLSLANAPEKNQAGFKEATAFTSKLCKVGSYAIVDQDMRQKTDKYGRIIAKVICDGKNLNSELITNGYAGILKQYCVKSEYSWEDWAQKNGC